MLAKILKQIMGFRTSSETTSPKDADHGGGWEKPLLYYRGYILMLQHLLEQGIKVRTYCSLSNIAAIRFDRSVGFVPYKYTDNEVFMWINTKRLKSSKLYKYFYH